MLLQVCSVDREYFIKHLHDSIDYAVKSFEMRKASPATGDNRFAAAGSSRPNTLVPDDSLMLILALCHSQVRKILAAAVKIAINMSP